jgi:hypothetical protein
VNSERRIIFHVFERFCGRRHIPMTMADWQSDFDRLAASTEEKVMKGKKFPLLARWPITGIPNSSTSQYSNTVECYIP